MADSRLSARGAGVLRPGGAVDEQPRGIEVGGHLGERGLRELEVGERRAELAARVHVGPGLVERPRREAAGRGADARAEEVERAEGDPHAVALLAEPLRGGHAAALELELGDRVRRGDVWRGPTVSPGASASTTNALIARFAPSAVRAKTTTKEAIVAFEVKILRPSST
jgi:hypothetical protein